MSQTNSNRQVVLVDANDNQIGLLDILKAHQNPGFLHRAISILLWRQTSTGKQILMQKRSQYKPLWPLFWSNTVCTHPYEGEAYLDCAVRRLKEEIGVQMAQSDLQILYRFQYQADFSKELSEHELDTVIVGEYNGTTQLNNQEVVSLRWQDTSLIKKDVMENPGQYTPWMKEIISIKGFF